MKSGTPRRAFLGQLAIGTAGLAAARRAAAAPLQGAALATGPGTRAAGDLARRIDLTARRLTQTGVPAYTEDFVLADVTLDTRRRFWNFSGDLSGRWIEALAAAAAGGPLPRRPRPARGASCSRSRGPTAASAGPTSPSPPPRPAPSTWRSCGATAVSSWA